MLSSRQNVLFLLGDASVVVVVVAVVFLPRIGFWMLNLEAQSRDKLLVSGLADCGFATCATCCLPALLYVHT